jgi:hypothetical protein
VSLAGSRLRRFAFLLLFILGRSVQGQQSSDTAGVDGSKVEIYLMTMGVGAQIWERFGHNAIGVRDRGAGTDIIYNYGTFDFAAPGFVSNFLKGRMTYWLDTVDAQVAIRWYRDRWQRSVYIQELDLLPAQRAELKGFLEWNAREENKFYRYDYYRDNCSTRIRDALDRLLGGRLQAATDSVYTGATYRSHTRRLTTNNPFIYTGIEAGMGPLVDRPISAWEEMFLPLAVREYVRDVTVTDSSGATVPLVREERTVYESKAHPFRDQPPSWVPWYLALGIAIGGVALILARKGTGIGWARTGFTVLATGWYLVMGCGGLILLGLWGFTDHLVTRQNENVLQFNLLALPLVVLLPMGMRRRGRWFQAAIRAALLVTALALLGLAVKVLPWFGQVNLEIIALVVPVYLGLLGGLLLLGKGPGSAQA